MSPPAEGEESTFKPFTTAERIQQLNDIDKSITALLHSAGLALQTLSSSATQASPLPTQNKREAFQEISNSYLRTLQSVDVRLRRQIYGLEEADIIPGEKSKPKGNGQESTAGEMAAMMAGQGAGAKEETLISVGDGGMGKLDIGWLNSRSQSVDRNMEGELWSKARAFLEGLQKTGEKGAEGDPEDMET